MAKQMSRYGQGDIQFDSSICALINEAAIQANSLALEKQLTEQHTLNQNNQKCIQVPTSNTQSIPSILFYRHLRFAART